MKPFVSRIGVILSLCVWGPMSQVLPSEVRADQYLLEGQRALAADDPAAALRAFEKLEALPVDPPVEFFYWYGKTLVEHGISKEDVATVTTGEGHLKQYVLDVGREAKHYASALEWISRAEGHGLPRPHRPAEDAEPSTDQAAAPQEPAQDADSKDTKLDQCDTRLWGEWDCSQNSLILSHSFDASGIEQVTVDHETGLFSRDRTTYPVDRKWHPNSKTGKIDRVSCNGWNDHGFRVLNVLTRDAPEQRFATYAHYFVDLCR